VNAKHKLLIYCFLSGDLSRFACEQGLLSEYLAAALRELISPSHQHWRLA